MLVKTFYHEGTPRVNVIMQGTLISLGSTIIIASRDNHRLDILANFRDEGGTLKADYNRIDLLAVSEETLDGTEADILLQFEEKIEPDVWKEIGPVADVQTVNPEHYELECPHCGKRDVKSGGTMTVGAKAPIYVVLASEGKLDWDYDEGDCQRDHLYATDTDYQHDHCYCEWCNQTFVEPNIVPTTDEERARLLQRQLEKEGQQRLPIKER